MKYIFGSLLSLFFLFSCASDDDICVSGEATPRMKIKFKQGTKDLQLTRLILEVDYGDGPKNVADIQRVDSIMVPLRVDELGYTDLYVRTSPTSTASKIRIAYTSESKYVSPACGIKKLYNEVNSSLETSSEVRSLEQAQNQITDELPTHLYLVF